MRTPKCIAILCCAILLLGGCTTELVAPQLNTDSISIDDIKYSEIYDDYMLYQQLTDTEKIGYGIVYTAVYDNLSADTSITDNQGNSVAGVRISLASHSLSLEQISRVFEAFSRDNPIFFFIDRTYSLEGRTINGTQVYDTLVLRYTMDAAQRVTATAQVKEAVQNILKGCPSTDDDYSVELYLHDLLLSFCAYDTPATTAPDQHPNAYSAYGALIEGKAVCEGYAKAMQLLLTEAGVPTTVVNGYSADNNTGHMWNLVAINGEYYYLDPTWNDNEKHSHYAYFNVTSKTLQRTHILDANTMLTVDCTAEKDNYFIRNKTYITSYDRDEIATAIAAQVQAGATSVHLSFEDGKYENGLLFLKNVTLTKKMVNARLTGGVQLWDYELSALGDQNVLSLHKVQ